MFIRTESYVNSFPDPLHFPGLCCMPSNIIALINKCDIRLQNEQH